MSRGRGGAQPIPRPASWRPGGPALWTGRAASIPDVATVERAIAGRVPSEIIRGPAVARPAQQGRRSAVLVALYDSDHGATTILTRRALHLRKHAGEISFPGGSIDDTDESTWAAALREAHEEIALDPTLPEPLGELDTFVTGASFSMVTPCVGRLHSKPRVEPAPEEVDEILHVSLATLMAPGVYREELWFWSGEERSMHFFDLDGDTVWGATALMLNQLLELLVAP